MNSNSEMNSKHNWVSVRSV